MLLEELSDDEGVVLVLSHANVKCFKAAKDEPSVERGRGSADGVLNEAELLVYVVEVSDDDTADDIGVTVNEFGSGVDDDIGAEGDGVLEEGAHEGIIDGEESVVLMSDGSEGGDVVEFKSGVSGGFSPKEFGIRLYGILDQL